MCYHFLKFMLHEDEYFFMTFLLTMINLSEKTSIIILIGKIRHRKMIIDLPLITQTNNSSGSDSGYCSDFMILTNTLRPPRQAVIILLFVVW